jgi:hypothetical protein
MRGERFMREIEFETEDHNFGNTTLKAFFHQWSLESVGYPQQVRTIAIIELVGGKILTVSPSRIKFVNSTERPASLPPSSDGR